MAQRDEWRNVRKLYDNSYARIHNDRTGWSIEFYNEGRRDCATMSLDWGAVHVDAWWDPDTNEWEPTVGSPDKDMRWVPKYVQKRAKQLQRDTYATKFQR